MPTRAMGAVLAVLAVLTLPVPVGGIKSIGRVTAGFVPTMVLSYVPGALYIPAVNIPAASTSAVSRSHLNPAGRANVTAQESR